MYIVSEAVLSIWSRIMGFVAALLSGLIFVLGGLRGVFFGESFAVNLINTLGLDPVVAQTYDMILSAAAYAGWIILAAAVLIILGRVRIAKIILFIVIGAGLLSFFLPVVAAIGQGTLSLQVLLNGDATMFLVATLFGIIAKLYCDKAT